MILISKNEAMYLAQKGLKWGADLHHSYSSAHKYYLTEKPAFLNLLSKYREGQVNGSN